ncbi:MAG: hypothetical protein IJ808_07550 [Muribaculaceae bacterium]|nr:hypothetical protein [Muribaculaceae bacterium]
MKRALRHIAWSLLAVMWLAGCDDNSCYDNGNSLPLARFCADGSSTAVTTSGLTVRGLGAPGDSLLLTDASVSEMYLPLRATTSQTQWELSWEADAVADTLTLTYDTTPAFSNAECGAMYQFVITAATCTSHRIDSVVVTQPRVTNVSHVNLQIYLP